MVNFAIFSVLDDTPVDALVGVKDQQDVLLRTHFDFVIPITHDGYVISLNHFWSFIILKIIDPYISREVDYKKDLLLLEDIDMNVDRLIKVNFTYSVYFPKYDKQAADSRSLDLTLEWNIWEYTQIISMFPDLFFLLDPQLIPFRRLIKTSMMVTTSSNQ